MDAVVVLLIVAVIGIYSVKKYKNNMRYGCCAAAVTGKRKSL